MFKWIKGNSEDEKFVGELINYMDDEIKSESHEKNIVGIRKTWLV